MKFQLIVACTKEGGIAHKNKIPWYLPPDLKHFRDITSSTKNKTYQNAIIMGRKTWESIGGTPLKDRLNIIISSTLHVSLQNVLVFSCIQDALNEIENLNRIEEVFLIGGSRIYEEGIRHPDCSGIYLTRVKYDGECDTFFPMKELKRFNLSFTTEWYDYNGTEYQYQHYTYMI